MSSFRSNSSSLLSKMSQISLWFSLAFVAFCFVNVSVAKKAPPEIEIHELKKGDLSMKVTNYGATIISLSVPDKSGKSADIVLGYDTVDEYKNDTVYFGALVGRVANRIGGAQFTLNGKTYRLSANDGKNTLHGGKIGFGDVIWRVKKIKTGKTPYITFNYKSHDGEEGFPGGLTVAVTYKLVENNRLVVIMKAKGHKLATPVNLAQHSYWNLGGHNSGDILSNEVHLFASHITPTNNELIPTGQITPIKGTPYDFLQSQTVASRLNQLPKGYDINYVLDKSPENVMDILKPVDKSFEKVASELKPVASVHDPKSGRLMQLMSNQPAVQFYTGGMLKDVKGKGGAVYGPHAGLALETQGFPDAVNHPNFPSQIVNPGEVYNHYMVYQFSTKSMCRTSSL